PPAVSATSPLFSWQETVLLFYLLGVGVCLVRVIRAGLRTRHVLRGASPSENADTEAEILRLAGPLGLQRAPRLRTSAGITIPVYARGTVLLPADANYTPDERRLVLAHELAHACRRDLVWEWLGTLTQIVFFFHPLVILARREERLARESAADALALQTTAVPAVQYGELLLAVSLMQTGPIRIAGIGIIENTTLLHRRLLALKEVSLVSSSYSRKFAAPLIIFGIVTFLPWRVTEAAPASQEKSPFPPTDASYLRYAAKLPLLPLSKALGLTPDQQKQINRIQIHIAQMQEKIYLRQAAHRRQLAKQYLPNVSPAQQTAEYAAASENLRRERPAGYQKYSKAMHRTIETGKQETRQLEQEASRSVLAVLSDKQEKALPGLLSEGAALKTVGIPIELYTDLELTADQKSKIAAITRASLGHRRQILNAAMTARKNEIKILLETAERVGFTDKPAIGKAEAQHDRQNKRSYISMIETLYQRKQQDHDAALAVLTGEQRSIIKAYFQAHPQQRSNSQQPNQRMVVQANRITRLASGILLEGATVTRYKGKRVVSQMKTSRAMLRIKRPWSYENAPTGKNIKFEIDPQYIGEIRASKGEMRINVDSPKKAPAR
ncbi:MAG: M56 family metallopeptidase, partial [Cytophagales bacterium]|nr:M56 family metallopeptidase [Armatimonadota bacterium]